MSQTSTELEACFGTERWDLPPLILHPFAEGYGPTRLVESSKAGLMLHGLLPKNGLSEDELVRKLLEGRFCEIRMLFFVGKDILRWMSQCLDFVTRLERLEKAGIREQSFAAFLIKEPPLGVQDKLKSWGVSDYRSIFSRAIGLNAVFHEAPAFENLSEDFLRHYYRYADHMFACRQQITPFTELSPANFHFELFASGEYSKMLERQWENSW